jgi:hypothetical protein
MNAVATPSRFLKDSTGTYDLVSVSAIIASHGAPNVASLVTDGGQILKTETALAEAVNLWEAYLDAPEPAPAATK